MKIFQSAGRRPTFDVLAECVVLVAALLHVAFLFLGLGATSLAVVNVASIGAHSIAFLLIRRGRRFQAFLIFVAEVVAHATIATFAIGWASGFHHYVILLAPIAAFAILLRMRVRLALVAAVIACYLAFDVLMRSRPPALALSPGVIEALYYFNLMGVVALLSFVTLFHCHLIEQREAALLVAADTDPLTQLPNRRSFMRAASAELSRVQDERAGCYLVICDLDHFKSINDRYGHDTGDAVLRAIGRLLAGEVRGRERLCRWGGEEFLFMLTRSESCQVLCFAERLRKRVEDFDFLHEGVSLRLSVTLGVARVPDVASIEHAIARADAGLYKGKGLGRNCVVLVDPE